MKTGAATMRRHLKKATDEILTAQAYADDGAYMSTAYHLREAADHFSSAARAKEAGLSKLAARSIVKKMEGKSHAS